MKRTRIVVIGGSAAGPKAAAKARRMDQFAEITIVQKSPDLSMASCGYPYYVGGVFDERNELLCTPTGVVRDPKFFMLAKGIRALTNTCAQNVDTASHKVFCENLESGEKTVLEYDKLVIATGAEPIIPPVPGADLEGITTLQSMKDADYLKEYCASAKGKKAVVIGGGLIGMETCEALNLAGASITVIEMLPQILSFLDWDLAKLLENHVRTKAANVITDNPVVEFLGAGGKLTGVKLKNGTQLPCDLAVVSVGVRPNVALAKQMGVETGERGGIVVDEYMRTNIPDVYAAGDCCEIVNLISGQKVHAPYGDLANLEGRVVGQNVVAGDKEKFRGTIQTGICKVFDYAAGSTGLSQSTAQKLGIEVESVITALLDKPGFMGAKPVMSKMVVEKSTGRLLGVQCIGPGNVSKVIACAAMAIMGKLGVEDIVCADMPYAPPFSQAIDALITTAHVMENKLRGAMVGIQAPELKKLLDSGNTPYLLDVRGPDEFEQMRLGIGEVLIPLGALRNRIDELPADKNTPIVCYCKISLRGYEAASLLMAHGYTDVKVLEGGLLCWPYAREK